MYEKITYYSRMSQTLHVPVPAASASTLKNDLLFYYEFSTAPTLLDDSSGNIRTLTNAIDGGGSVTFGTGIITGGAACAGNQDIGLSSNLPNYAGMNAFSFVIWVNLSSNASTQWLISKGNTHDEFFLGVTGGDTNSFWTAGGISAVSVGNALTTGGWHMIYCDYNNGNISVTVDNNPATTGTAGGGSPQAGSGGVLVFADILSPSNGLLNGTIDQIGSWSRTLTSSEKSQLYNGGSALAYSGF